MKKQEDRRRKSGKPKIVPFPEPKVRNYNWVIEQLRRGGWTPHYGGRDYGNKSLVVADMKTLEPIFKDRQFRVVKYVRVGES